MCTVFHLMDFDKVERYNLVVKPGPFSADSWELQDEVGRPVREMVSYAMSSDAVSEEHQVVLKRKDDSLLKLALVGVSSWRNSQSSSKPSDGSGSPP